MKNVIAVSMLGLFLAVSAQAQAKPDVGKVNVAGPTTTNISSTIPVSKPVPAELLSQFAEWNALNNAVAKIKQEDGLPKLESELEQLRLGVLATAAKDGFHWDPATSTFVEDAPKPTEKTPAPVTPAPATKPAAKK